ncbi:Sucrase/ferredoxin-like-domain-containing protein [Fimicolochytrium jonesii]|uniref:Sucrase/ferredoxin-like-domain-containing protein n=1 Tax=Fimicolochytrium jonesii TaxID=1396493 RepID=UPI0022FED3A3|nr:Sucrase/ferredoxin-like-domain-containing protein [Fimicolochytrium jonesii]KAI8824369.1 Sucrase/ferredoxin-like-domain-containing protein [Fimicolochytrium jonesii]
MASLFKKILGVGEVNPFPADVPFTDADPCAGCATPCTTHEQIPGYLQKKIEPGPLVGTMKPYKRHIMVVEGTSRTWRERIEEGDEEKVTNAVSKAVEIAELGYRTIVTACDPMPEESDAAASAGTEGHAVWLFPDLLSIPSVDAASATGAIDTLLAMKDAPVPSVDPSANSIDAVTTSSNPLTPVPLEGRAWIFVCTHKKRDKRCGVAGPLLVNEFRRALKEMNIDDVHVFGCSHFGGHKYAGNVIIYHRNPAVDGNWYGRVTACHVRPILQTTILDGQIFKELWRGAMQKSADIVAKRGKEW